MGGIEGTWSVPLVSDQLLGIGIVLMIAIPALVIGGFQLLEKLHLIRLSGDK
jgi:hypothetical protein